MATTVETADLTVTITENYSLMGTDYGSTCTKTYTTNGEVIQRLMSIAGKGSGETTTFTDILALSTVDGRGQVVKADYKYFRIKNLDDTNNLNLRLYNGADYIYFKVEPYCAVVLMSPDLDATTTDGIANVSFADIQAIAGQSSHETDAVDVEFIVVTT
tara:strand:+ start:2543 stop:3019 length:477 start_codon:yes stop_codon:yes gene_type:complete